jgi:hypothetical protein
VNGQRAAMPRNLHSPVYGHGHFRVWCAACGEAWPCAASGQQSDVTKWRDGMLRLQSQTAPVDECGRTATQAAEVAKQAADARDRAALVSDLAAFVERAAQRPPLYCGGFTAPVCVWCQRSTYTHAADCLYTVAQSLAARITAAGLSVDSAASGESKGE